MTQCLPDITLPVGSVTFVPVMNKTLEDLGANFTWGEPSGRATSLQLKKEIWKQRKSVPRLPYKLLHDSLTCTFLFMNKLSLNFESYTTNREAKVVLKNHSFALWGAGEGLSTTVPRFKINQIKWAWVQTVKMQNPQAISTMIINFTHRSILLKIWMSLLNLKASKCNWVNKILSGNSASGEKSL